AAEAPPPPPPPPRPPPPPPPPPAATPAPAAAPATRPGAVVRCAPVSVFVTGAQRTIARHRAGQGGRGGREGCRTGPDRAGQGGGPGRAPGRARPGAGQSGGRPRFSRRVGPAYSAGYTPRSCRRGIRWSTMSSRPEGISQG